jgi:hypothetical protein
MLLVAQCLPLRMILQLGVQSLTGHHARVNLGSSPSHARNVPLLLNLHTGCVSPQYHCCFDDFFETVRQGGPDVSVSSAWEQLSGLTVVSQTPSMDHHDEVPHHSQCIQFENHPITRSQEFDDTISFGDTAGTPIFFDHPMQDFNNDQSVTTVNEGVTASQLPLQPSHDSADLQDAPSSAGTSLQGRVCKMSRAMAESVSQRDFYGKEKMHYMASQAVCEHDYNHLHDSHLNLQDRMRHSIAFLAEMMGDVMYLHQALRQPDSKEFVEAVIKKVIGHVDNNHWKLIPHTEVPEGTEVVPSVWALQHKRDLTTGKVTKHKARLNLHGGKQEFGTNYYETYAPIVTWFAIQLLIVIGILFDWALCQVDFIMAHPQAPIKMDMYMELPTGIHTKHGNSKDHILKLLANIYGQKRAGRVWNSYLITKLPEINFKQSLIDDCIIYWDNVIFIVYIDNGIFLGPSDQQLHDIINELRNLKLSIEDEGHPADYVGVSIKKLKNGVIELTQQALIDSIISDLALGNSKVKAVPAKVSKILHVHLDKPPFSSNFGYRLVISKLNYLAQTTRPDIVYVTHQLAKYSSNPIEPHGEAVLYPIQEDPRLRNTFQARPRQGIQVLLRR